MTIKVTITNSDTRENAIIEAKNLSHNDEVLSNRISLKGGESAELWIHGSQDILITEVQNG